MIMSMVAGISAIMALVTIIITIVLMVLLETSLRASNKPYQQSIAAHVCCYKLRTFNKPFVSVFF